VINLNNDNKNILSGIIKPKLKAMLDTKDNIYAGMPKPNNINHKTILDMNRNKWLRCLTITSKQFRLLLKEGEQITNTKLTLLIPHEAKSMYKNTNRIRSI
jgi:hypothetical protein